MGRTALYRYGPSGFPTDTFNSTNYWVDVVFDTSVDVDTASPTVTAVDADARSDRRSRPSTAITATFSEDDQRLDADRHRRSS